MKLNINTAMREIDEIKNSDKTEEEKLKAINEKAMRALKRAKPHAENFDNYVHGRSSSR